MDEIRAFTEEHVGDVANLYMKVGRGRFRPAPQALKDYFREIYFRNPWVSEDITSLVYLSNGKVIGFLGAIPREMEFRGQPIRVAIVSPFIVDRDSNQGLAGMKLARQLFKGPQDFSFTDGSSNHATSVYTTVGAQVSHLYSFNWIRILRPFQTARVLLNRSGGLSSKLSVISGAVTTPLDFALSKSPLTMFQPPRSPFFSKQVTAPELLECIQEARGREALKPAYSMPSFVWLMSQSANEPGHGFPRMITVHTPDGTRAGWFVYQAQPGKAAFLLQIGSHRRQHFTSVLLALFQDAWGQGSSEIKGQALPQFLTNLTEQQCIFRQPHASVVGYSRNPAIINAFQSGDASISRLDGHSWLRFPYDAPS